MAGAKLYMTAAEAAETLNISLPTLYAYVSRGMIRSDFADRSKRTRRYHAEDVQRLKERKEQRRDPSRAVDTALYWGAPVLDSALTWIDQGRLSYRGQDVSVLAADHSVEEVAALLWLGDRTQGEALFQSAAPAISARCEAVRRHLSGCAPMERFQTLLPLAAIDDLAAYDLRPAAVAQTGARLLRLLTTLAADRPLPGESIAVTLQRIWRPNDAQAARLFKAALILCTDHELNVSSFTARCVASAGSSPYAVVSAGLAALQGGKHGGSCARVEALLKEVGSPENARTALADRMRRGEITPGFGHPLYPQGDPRGKLLLAWTAQAYPNSPAVALAESLIREAKQAFDDYPNIDFGLVTLCEALGLPAGTAIALFALGRTIGWIGHAIEEYQADRLIRPRAHYITPAF